LINILKCNVDGSGTENLNLISDDNFGSGPKLVPFMPTTVTGEN